MGEQAIVMTGRRHMKAASSSQSLTKLSTQTIPEMFSGETKSLSSHLSPKAWVTVRIRLSFTPRPLSLPLPLPLPQVVRAGDHLKQMSNNGNATVTFPPVRLLMTKATRVMSASLI